MMYELPNKNRGFHLRYYLTDTGEIWPKKHDFLIFSEEMHQFMYKMLMNGLKLLFSVSVKTYLKAKTYVVMLKDV